MHENQFRNKLIQDLWKKKGINVVNLYEGTFDLVIEGGSRPFLVELKRLRYSGVRLTDKQAEEIFSMKFPPVIIAFTEKKYYLLTPEWVKAEVTKQINDYRPSHQKVWLDPDYCRFPKPLTYEELLSELAKL